MTITEALEYGQLGHRVFPLQKRAKLPAVKEWQNVAASDPTEIRGLYTHADPNVGLIGGTTHHGKYLVIIDVDEHDPAHPGTEILAELEDTHGELPETVTCLTPTGGQHLYYLTPQPLTNAAGTNLPTGIDIRGHGGFVVAPPSVHPDGGRYEWESGYGLDEHDIADLPETWVELLEKDPLGARERTVTTKRAPSQWDQLDDRPGTRYEQETTWAELLEPDGWVYTGTGHSGEQQWRRPGKERGRSSATVNYGGADRLVVHSTAAPIPADSYSKLGYYATTRHAGDYSAATTALAEQYAEKRPTPAPSVWDAIGDQEVIVWPDPIPLDSEHPPEPFPLHALPEWIRTQAEQVANELQVATDLPAMLALGALSTICAGRYDVQIDGPWTETTNLYVVVALPPGAGKSPAFSMMLGKPLGQYENRLIENGATQRRIDRAKHRGLVKDLDRDATQLTDSELEILADQIDALETQLAEPKLFVDDVTVEALVTALKEQNGRLCLASTEGGVFGQMTGRYSDKQSSLDPYLQAWSGDTIRQTRMTREEVVVRNPTLTVAVTVQPSVIAALADNPDLRGRGLTARFMYSYPFDNVGQRDHHQTFEYDTKIADTYTDELLDLAQTAETFKEAPKRLRLSRDAARLIRDLKQRHERQMGESGDLYHMREWITKLQSSVGRLSALLHIAERCDGDIDVETVQRAITIGEYWTSHAARVHDLFAHAAGPDKTALALLEWIHKKYPDGGHVTFSEVKRGPRRFREEGIAENALTLLSDLGWLKPDFDGPLVATRGKESPRFAINPRANLATPLVQGGAMVQGSSQTVTDSDDSTTQSTQRRAIAPLHLEGLKTPLSLSKDTDRERSPKSGAMVQRSPEPLPDVPGEPDTTPTEPDHQPTKETPTCPF